MIRLIFAKSGWEIETQPLERIIERVSGNGYDMLELYIPGRSETPEQISRQVQSAKLPMIAQIGTGGKNPAEHSASLEKWYGIAVAAGAVFVNCHTGSDFFSLDDNLRVFDRATELSSKHGVPIVHETHRGRSTFSLPSTLQLLKQRPELRLTLDVSHWFNVHESDLADQKDQLELVVARVDHVHARVGFAQGPQVSDPRNPAYAEWVENSLAVWKRVIDSATARGKKELTITPEFGPPLYAPLAQGVSSGVTDAWENNLWMRDVIKTRFA